jgi:hypothetical protein
VHIFVSVLFEEENMDDHRSDEAGSKRLIATRVPAHLYAAVQQAADEELISSASWVRRAIAQAVRQAAKVNAHG